jgi:hypothetical protein
MQIMPCKQLVKRIESILINQLKGIESMKTYIIFILLYSFGIAYALHCLFNSILKGFKI